MSTTRTPVLIVGAGAGGLATSALLAKHGIGSMLVEKRREVFAYPKARNLSFRTLEILRGLGLADRIHAIADGLSAMAVKPTLNSSDEELVDFAAMFREFEALSHEPPVQYCPQSKLEPILLDHARRHGNEVRYSTELVSFDQDETGVSAVVHDRDTGHDTSVRAAYLVAADGVHSQVRDTLGITTQGHDALPIYVVFIYFRAPWRRFVDHLGPGGAVQVKNTDVDGIFLSVEGDLGMFIATYLPSRGESAAQFTAQRCSELIRAGVGEEIPVEIVDVAAWRPYERVADQFRCQRVFLVGDAAHAMPPFKAGGANAAIQSADNLAWKLAAVLRGRADEKLLDSYHAERHPVGRFSARQSLTGPTVAFLRLEAKTPGLPEVEEAPMFALLAGYQYRSSAVISDEASTGDGMAVVDKLCGQPGTRVPHLWVDHAGSRVSTLDLLGPGFTVFTDDDGDGWDAAAASVGQTLRVPVDVHRVGGRWTDVTGLSRGGALVVRPDAFVGWRSTTLPERPDHELAHSLSGILHRT
jgi:2-polyprenyl-6-methoxyphenol hydroxylase-like FAD-dependent oxidoreductase